MQVSKIDILQGSASLLNGSDIYIYMILEYPKKNLEYR